MSNRIDHKAILRNANKGDLPLIIEISNICYAPIIESYRNIVGENFYKAVVPGDWRERKANQIRNIYSQNPENVWVLEKQNRVIGFIAFVVNEVKEIGIIENNAILPPYTGKGLGTYMYKEVLKHFKTIGLKFALVETDNDDVHIPARKAYESSGFNRKQVMTNYIKEL